MAKTTSAAWSPHFDDVDLGQLPAVGAVVPLFDTRPQSSIPFKHSSKPKPFDQHKGNDKAI